MLYIINHLPEILLIAMIILFIYSLHKDARRFRNAVYLLLILMLVFQNLIIYESVMPNLFVITMIFAFAIIILVFIVPFLLILNGIQMIVREGIHITSFLSMAFGIFIIAGEVSIIPTLGDFTAYKISQAIPALAFGLIVLYVSLAYLAFMFYSAFMHILPKQVNFDYIIVLGAGLKDGLTPNKILSNRLDKAMKVFRKTMSSSYIVVSGGQGSDELVSEAEAMKNYLIDHGIKNHEIIIEDKSTNTYENIRNSYEIIQKRKGRQQIAVVTSDFHVYRAVLLCKQFNFQATGIGAHTAFYYWPTAMIREYVAICKYYMKPYLLGMFLFVGGILSILFLI